MRTTLSIPDDILIELRERARTKQIPLTRVVAETLRAGLDRGASAAPRAPYRQRVFDLGKPRVDLKHALRVAAALEDEEIARKMDLGK